MNRPIYSPKAGEKGRAQSGLISVERVGHQAGTLDRLDRRSLRVHAQQPQPVRDQEQPVALHHRRSAEPLQRTRRSLRQGSSTDSKLEFVSRVTVDIKNHTDNAYEVIDLRRKSPLKDRSLLESAVRRFVRSLEDHNFERPAVQAAVKYFRSELLRDETGAEISIRDLVRRGKTEEHFNNWFFDVSVYSVKYSVRFDGKDLELLSPGQKGIVLLLVYLEVDNDQRPLIIDQPEDNLDNRTVYADLIQFFKSRKKQRQLIVITHNPNLVVNTDSEQVIVACFDGAADPHIMYEAGGLENIGQAADEPNVRKLVCDIVEGGSEAFLKREKKYSLQATVN